MESKTKPRFGTLEWRVNKNRKVDITRNTRSWNRINILILLNDQIF